MVIEYFGPVPPGALDNLRKKIGPEKWEKITKESETRNKLKRFSGITEELIDGAIISMVTARAKRNNKIANLPIVNKDGNVCCVICNATPVVSSFALAPDRDPESIHDDVTFITFICRRHAENPELTQKDLDDNHVLWHLLEWRRQEIAAGVYTPAS